MLDCTQRSHHAERRRQSNGANGQRLINFTQASEWRVDGGPRRKSIGSRKLRGSRTQAILNGSDVDMNPALRH